jgi:hypothetical protein
MEKNYKILNDYYNTIDEAVMKLVMHTVKNKGELVCCEFNGTTLYSDTVSLDSAFQSIVGKPYNKFNEDQKAWREEYERKEEEYKQTIPVLTKEWQEKGHEILTKNKWSYWDEIVPIRLTDLYHGMELGCCLDLVKMLNNGCSLDDTKKTIENQDHSGMSSLIFGANADHAKVRECRLQHVHRLIITLRVGRLHQEAVLVHESDVIRHNSFRRLAIDESQVYPEPLDFRSGVKELRLRVSRIAVERLHEVERLQAVSGHAYAASADRGVDGERFG